jgi:hypothetical protein
MIKAAASAELLTQRHKEHKEHKEKQIIRGIGPITAQVTSSTDISH